MASRFLLKSVYIWWTRPKLFAAMKAQIIQNISKKLVMRMCSWLPAGIFSWRWCVICLFIHELHSVRDITIFVKKTTRFWLAENECIFYVTRVHSCNFSEFWKHFFSPRHVKKKGRYFTCPSLLFSYLGIPKTTFCKCGNFCDQIPLRKRRNCQAKIVFI